MTDAKPRYRVPAVMADTLQNFVSGLGTERDKSYFNRYALHAINREQLLAAYRGDWIARKVVDTPVFDATREWRAWQADDPQIEALEETEKRLGVQQKLNAAMTRARLFGGSVIVMGFGDDPTQPLDVNRVGKDGLKFLHVASRHEITAGQIDRDIMSPNYGLASYYEIPSMTAALVRIHPSRVVRLIGNDIPDLSLATDGWGDSVLQSVDDALKAAGLSITGMASLINEAKTDVIKMPNLADMVSTEEDRARLTGRFTAAMVQKSLTNTLMLDSEEDWNRVQMTWAGIPDIIRTYLMIASAAADIPATRFLGQSPNGMSATGDSDTRNYYDRIASDQENMLTPAMRQLDEVLIRSALGTRPKEVYYEWRPLWQMDDVQRASIAKQKADALAIYDTHGLVPHDALAKATQNMLVEDGLLPGLEAALIEFPDDEPDEADPQVQAQFTQQQLLPPPAQQITADAAPRSLYVRRDVLNRAEIVAWAKGQGFTEIVPDLHVTIAYSTTPVDWFSVGTSWTEKVEIAAGGPRQMERLGADGKYIALLITANELVWRNREIREAGASWDWPEYQPHISIQIGGEVPDGVKPYQGKIVLGPEIFEEVRGD